MSDRSGASSSSKRNKSRKHKSTGSGKTNTELCKTSDSVSPGANEELQASLQQRSFELELAWCIQQLDLSLQKAVSAKQGADALRVLNVLKNPKAALVKKRHAMRTTFGDYRKKMLEEEKTFASAAKNIVLQTARKRKQDKSSFLRTCVSHTPGATHLTTSSPTQVASEPATRTDADDEFISNKAACFRFNFGVSDSIGETSTHSSSASDGAACQSSALNNKEISVDTKDKSTQHRINAGTAKGYCDFKKLPSDNSFRFNFAATQDSAALETDQT